MNLKRRKLLQTIPALAAASATGMKAARASISHYPPTKRPNIFIFLTDDHAQWLQQSYGNSEVQTPNMLHLARNGVRMTNAFTTCLVCSPARASFFTGRMPSQHGIHDWLEQTAEAYQIPWLQG